MGIFSIIFLETHKANFQALTKSKETETEQKIFFKKTEFSGIKWIEKNEELEWQGKLFDVSKIEETENGFIVYCENDQWEEEFVSLFSSWKDQKKSEGKFKFFFQPMFLTVQNHIPLIFISETQKLKGYSQHCSGSFSQVISPPPDHSLSLC